MGLRSQKDTARSKGAFEAATASSRAAPRRAQNDFFQVWVQKNVNNFYNRWTFVFSARVHIYTAGFWSPGLGDRGTYLLAAW
jgi:hypothetical protein